MTFRALALLATMIPLFGSSLVTAAEAAQQPNILFIFSDDLTCQAISAYGEKRRLLETPSMDRIAREGMRFNRCLVTNSICGPSRATILTGKYSHLNGFYNNTNSRFDGSQQTFPKLLQKAGYTTAIIGKWHLVTDPTGFDHWHILPGQGVYYNPPMIDNGRRIKHEGYTTDVITDLSIEWLENRDKSKPFMLMTQHKAPHREWSPALRHLGWDNDRKHPEPETLFDDYAGRSKAVRDHDMGLDRTFTDLDAKIDTPSSLNEEQRKKWHAYYEPRNKAFREANLEGKDLVRWRYNRYMHDYLGCVKAVDESVGRLLDYLDREGLAENTVVICSSDQGFYLGEHGWFDKRWMYEESFRTPLLIRWPGKIEAGSVCDSLVMNLDFAETFVDIAGAPVPDDMQGRSIVPILEGKDVPDWRTSVYYHYYEHPAVHSVHRHLGVRDERYKLMHFYQLDEWEMYDLETDPHEMQSVYGDPKYADVQARLLAELKRLQEKYKDDGTVAKFDEAEKE
jgi:arylsulfatase A-like enzyme